MFEAEGTGGSKFSLPLQWTVMELTPRQGLEGLAGLVDQGPCRS